MDKLRTIVAAKLVALFSVAGAASKIRASTEPKASQRNNLGGYTSSCHEYQIGIGGRASQQQTSISCCDNHLELVSVELKPIFYIIILLIGTSN